MDSDFAEIQKLQSLVGQDLKILTTQVLKTRRIRRSKIPFKNPLEETDFGATPETHWHPRLPETRPRSPPAEQV